MASEVILAHLTHALFFIWHLIMCHLIADIWWDILNSFMARGWSAFLWIFQKNCKLWEAETHRLHLCWCDTTPMHSEEQLLYLETLWSILSKKNPLLVVTVKLIWLLFLNIFSFNSFQTPNKPLRFKNLEEAMHTTLLAFKPTTVKLHFLSWLMCAVQSVYISFFAAVCP